MDGFYMDGFTALNAIRVIVDILDPVQGLLKFKLLANVKISTLRYGIHW